MFRIITGKWKGKKIGAPKNFDVRPTTDFAKEGLFSILNHKFQWENLQVLDLFAGIGSISIEFGSRGVASVLAIEANQKHASFIHETAKILEMKQLQVIRGDVVELLKKKKLPKNHFDVVFADPPFEFTDAQYQQIIELALHDFWLKENGYLIIEHASRQKIEHPNLIETRKFANVSFSFFKLQPMLESEK